MAMSVPYVHLRPGNRRCNHGTESDCVTDFLELKNVDVYGVCAKIQIFHPQHFINADPGVSLESHA